jgi:hypothetical protein
MFVVPVVVAVDSMVEVAVEVNDVNWLWQLHVFRV